MMFLIDTLKNLLKVSSDADLSKIDVSNIIVTEENESIDDFNATKLFINFDFSIQNILNEKIELTKSLLSILEELDTSKVDINSFYINVSDGERNIEEAIQNSLKLSLSPNQDLLSQVIKSDTNLTLISELSSFINPYSIQGIVKDYISHHPNLRC